MTHCSLCVPSLPSDALYVFFDCDQVLIDKDPSQTPISSTYSQLPSAMTYNLRSRTAASLHFSKSALHHLKVFNDENEKVGRKVVWVILSSWAEDGTLQEFRETVFGMHFFALSIVGKVPKKASESQGQNPRTKAKQAEYWLREHGLLAANFVLIDDYDDRLSDLFPNRFVKVTDNIFSRLHLEQALACVGIHRVATLVNNISINRLSLLVMRKEISNMSADEKLILTGLLEDPSFKEKQHLLFKRWERSITWLKNDGYLDAECNLRPNARNVLEVSMRPAKDYKYELIPLEETLRNPQPEDSISCERYSETPLSTVLFDQS